MVIKVFSEELEESFSKLFYWHFVDTGKLVSVKLNIIMFFIFPGFSTVLRFSVRWSFFFFFFFKYSVNA